MDVSILKLKTRWLRWLGQKTREDKPYWTDLLDCNWTCWAHSVLERHGTFERPKMVRESVKEYFHTAILFAWEDDLRKLDNLYVQDKYERRSRE